MAKATMLSFQERRAARDFDRSEPLARDLAEDGRFSAKPSELLKAVGNMLLAESRLNGRAGVLDRPDLLWDNPGLSGLYARLEGDYELHDRAITLDRKLTTLSHTSETLVETMRYHSSHRLETAILLLIFVELCLGLYGHFRSGRALAGNQIEKRARATLSYETTVRMNNGSSRTVGQDTQPVWRDGDHVRVVDGVVRMNG
jgi:uncharacterized Rmd1/YagE family protein